MRNFFATYEYAYYNPLGQFICLNKYNKNIGLQLIHSSICESNFDIYKLLIHEYRHWIDHISTNYGQEYLYSIYNQFSSTITSASLNVSPIDPSRIHNLIYLNDLYSIDEKIILLNDNPENLWKLNLNFSMLENIPITVTRFLGQDDRQICKTPVTYLSLFEANAIYEELHLIHHFTNDNYRLRSERERASTMEYLSYAQNSYNSELIEYSVAAHFIAAIFNIPHVLNSYDIASQISTLLLNLNESQLDTLRMRITPNHKTHSHLLINRDFGYLLYCLCVEYSDFQRGKAYFDLEHFLNFFSLSDSKTLESEILQTMHERISHFDQNSCLYSKYCEMAQRGIEYFKIRGLTGRKKTTLSLLKRDLELKIPFILFGDEIWESRSIDYLVSKNLISLNNYEWYDFISELRKINTALIEKI